MRVPEASNFPLLGGCEFHPHIYPKVGLRHGMLHLKKEENVLVHEEVEGEEPLTFSLHTPLHEIRMEECKINPHRVLHWKKNLLFQMITHLMNHHKMCQGKDLKGNEGNGLEIGGLLPRRWSVPPLHF